MAVPESMVRMTFSSTVPEYLVEFSQDELDELAHIMPAELAFKVTDYSLLAGRTLQMCVWDAQNIEPPVIDPNPASRTGLVELVALHFLFTLSVKLSFDTTVRRKDMGPLSECRCPFWNQRVCRGCPKLHAPRTLFCRVQR
jgi:hypothetical protein